MGDNFECFMSRKLRPAGLDDLSVQDTPLLIDHSRTDMIIIKVCHSLQRLARLLHCLSQPKTLFQTLRQISHRIRDLKLPSQSCRQHHAPSEFICPSFLLPESASSSSSSSFMLIPVVGADASGLDVMVDKIA